MLHLSTLDLWDLDGQSLERCILQIANVAVGGNFVGFSVEQTPSPQSMVVDYVRVYEITN